MNVFTAVKKNISLADSILIINENFQPELSFAESSPKNWTDLHNSSLVVHVSSSLEFLEGVHSKSVVNSKHPLCWTKVHCIQIRQMYKWG